jgi:TolB-like protein
MTDPHLSEPPVPEAAAPGVVDRLRPRLKLVGGALASVAALGAVIGGLTGYWSAWKVVQTDLLHIATGPASPPSQIVVSKGPSVAVLPIGNSIGGIAFDPITDILTQQLTSSLGKYSTWRVTPRAIASDFAKQPSAAEAARKAGVDYLVTGEIRPLGEGMRASFQVSDLGTGMEIWSKSFDASADSVHFATAGYEIGDIAGAQIGGSPGAIISAEYKKAQGRPVADLSAYECIVQTIMAGFIQTSAVVVRARECIDRVTQSEPANALAWSTKSAILLNQRFSGFGLARDQATHLDKRLYLNDEIVRAASRAVELAPDDSSVRWRYANAVATTCQIDLFKQQVEKAVALSPNDPSVLGNLGNQLAFMGDWDAGTAMAEKAIRLMGVGASYAWWYGPAKRHWVRGEYQAAYEAFRHAYVERLFLTHLDQAYTLPFLNRIDDAKAEVAKLRALMPDFTIREANAFYRMYCFQPAFIEKMDGALRQAGLPE